MGYYPAGFTAAARSFNFVSTFAVIMSPSLNSHGPMLTGNPSMVSAIHPDSVFATIFTVSITHEGETCHIW